MSSPGVKAELADIRHALWELLLDVKAGDLAPETGETACSVLDSLIETVRLELCEATEAKRTTDEEEEAAAEQQVKGGGAMR